MESYITKPKNTNITIITATLEKWRLMAGEGKKLNPKLTARRLKSYKKEKYYRVWIGKNFSGPLFVPII